ncbi:MAG: hypothetical protein ISS36_02955 [Candidatus Aenigmarchaeota archaeon]|nr:hypothetical protein [Candidatus Aenigmarchaeota archaeon]
MRISNRILIIILILAILIPTLFLTIGVQTPSGKFTGDLNLTVETCEETDYGRDPYNFGEVTATTVDAAIKETRVFVDYCRADNLLVEYYCKDDKLKTSGIECSFYGSEWKCREGVCVK